MLFTNGQVREAIWFIQGYKVHCLKRRCLYRFGRSWKRFPIRYELNHRCLTPVSLLNSLLPQNVHLPRIRCFLTPSFTSPIHKLRPISLYASPSAGPKCKSLLTFISPRSAENYQNRPDIAHNMDHLLPLFTRVAVILAGRNILGSFPRETPRQKELSKLPIRIHRNSSSVVLKRPHHHVAPNSLHLSLTNPPGARNSLISHDLPGTNSF